MKSEFELIEAIKKKIPANMRGRIGIGDDAGALNLKAGQFLLASDTVVDGIDFISAKIKPELAGRKALAVNLSDIAAMGGEPSGFVVNLGIPENFSQNWILKFYDGMMALAGKFKMPCLGGDITKSGQFFSSITILGKAGKKTILRSGAKTADWIGVTGKLGGSILGRHASFEPRVKEGKFLAESGVSAMLDVSDGLLQDLGHLLKISRKGAHLEITDIPISDAAWELSGSKGYLKALEHALTDGEDFELLFTASDRVKNKLNSVWKKKFLLQNLYWLGRISGQKEKIKWHRRGKKIKAPRLKSRGYTHF